MPYYQNHVNDRDWASLCPGAEEFYQREIGLPIFPAMTDSDVDDVVNALNKIASHLPK
jgi:perosamine synthetase